MAHFGSYSSACSKEAQKCFCESPSCRGIIGVSGGTMIDLDGSRITPKQRIKIAELDAKMKSSQEFEDLAVSIQWLM